LQRPLTTHHAKHAARDDKGQFTRLSPDAIAKVEFWSETFLDRVIPPWPDFVEPPRRPGCPP